MKDNRLKKAREEKELNQEQLDKLVSAMGKSSVSKWENGYSTPTLETAIKLSRVLNKDIEFLFGHDIQETHTDEVAN